MLAVCKTCDGDDDYEVISACPYFGTDASMCTLCTVERCWHMQIRDAFRSCTNILLSVETLNANTRIWTTLVWPRFEARRWGLVFFSVHFWVNVRILRQICTWFQGCLYSGLDCLTIIFVDLLRRAVGIEIFDLSGLYFFMRIFMQMGCMKY